MKKRREALVDIERVDSKGTRVSFSSSCYTADRELWRKKQRIQEQMDQVLLTGDAAALALLKKDFDAIDAGGRLIIYPKAVLSRDRGMHVSVKEKVVSVVMQPMNDGTKKAKAPNHWVNRTLNFYLLDSKERRKVHTGLLMRVNGERLMY